MAQQPPILIERVNVPTVTVEQMREVDRLMVEAFGITLLQMMENAGRALAELARWRLGGDVRGRRVVVLAGRGGNGGGGLVAARRLSIWGAAVSVALSHPRDQFDGVPAHQLAIVERLGLPVSSTADVENLAERPAADQAGNDAALPEADLVLDALVGYSLRGAPRGPVAALIRTANASGARILALDVPSGLDGDTGEALDPTIRANATLTLALPKTGLLRPAARAWIGDLYLADISVPAAVYRRLGLPVETIFAQSDIVRLALDRSA
ncbi:MAG: NAD(P)H-hydrate epimerase [Chloroflexi bacterium]|nr:NAD(P)H-hydrate epimerase [Chloroflexota bacterium]